MKRIAIIAIVLLSTLAASAQTVQSATTATTTQTTSTNTQTTQAKTKGGFTCDISSGVAKGFSTDMPMYSIREAVGYKFGTFPASVYATISTGAALNLTNSTFLKMNELGALVSYDFLNFKNTDGALALDLSFSSNISSQTPWKYNCYGADLVLKNCSRKVSMSFGLRYYDTRSGEVKSHLAPSLRFAFYF